MRNPGASLSLEDVLRFTGVSRRDAVREIEKFEKLGLLKRKRLRMVISEVKGKGKTKKIRLRSKVVTVYAVNQSFELFRELRELVLRQIPESRHVLVEKLRRTGKIRLAVAAGAFINSDNSRVDLLVVGDGINRKRLDSLLQQWEANAGRELSYAVMSTEEFRYRQDMFDRFIRDIFDGAHDKLVNTLNVP